jgi:endonuclease YncB( thermonuclease family)
MLTGQARAMARRILVVSLGLHAAALVVAISANAQSSAPAAVPASGDLDMGVPTAPAATPVLPAHQPGSLDMDLEPTPPAGPVSGSSGVSTAPVIPQSIQAGIKEAPTAPTTLAGEPAPRTPAPPAPVVLEHPTVPDTAKLQAGDQTVELFGITGLGGEEAQGLEHYIAASGDRVSCEAQGTAEDICKLPDGTDVALAALINGAAQTRDDAPELYHDNEADAQAARRGVWASLPPPPVPLKHPAVENTATLVADGQTYVLAGIQGFPGTPARDLEGYIAANGDMVTCQPEGDTGRNVCLLADGTDLAKVVLVNGAAEVTADAPDSYRVQQRVAMDDHRGIWASPTPAMLAMAAPAESVFVLTDGDEADGITYVGDEPTAVIDGATVFLVYGGPVGWGYYDHYHHWHRAPDRFARHMDRFHPAGHGLHGYGDHGVREAAVGRPDHPGFGAPHSGMTGFRAPPREAMYVHPTGMTRPMGAAPGYHPGMAPSTFHPGMAPSTFHPGMPTSAFHPGEAPSAFHPGLAGSSFHPGAAMPAFHAAAPTAHVSAAASRKK